MSPANVELITGIVSCALTIMVLSYLIGDNPFFRVAVYLFIGVSAGYVTAVAWYQVLVPRLISPLLQGGTDLWLLIVPLVLGGLLLMKISPRLSPLGSPSLGFMVGVGTAVAIGGAVLGTLIPQIQAAITPFDLRLAGSSALALERLFEGSVMLVGTVSTLAFFHFGAKQQPGNVVTRNRLIEVLAIIGRFFIAVTFGVLFAGAYAAALTALVSRLYFVWSFVVSLF
jgi:hypothetical protein